MSSNQQSAVSTQPNRVAQAPSPVRGFCSFCRDGIHGICPGAPICDCPHDHLPLADGEDFGDVSTHLLEVPA